MAKKIESFNDIVGHDNLIRYIKRQVEKDTVPDVMIFHGSPGLGKSSIAKVLAVEIATRYMPELKEQYIQSVIRENKDTDSIKLFNMSMIQEKEEEVQKVRDEMVIGFSRTKRKILILDEAHNMSKKAQDSILVDLEHLPQGVYVIICTTEVGQLKEALQSRSKATFALQNLSPAQFRSLVTRIIEDRRLKFNMSTDMVIATIASWAGSQPRRAWNLLENFEEGSVITAADIEVFIEFTDAGVIIELLKYLYGSLVLGMQYLQDCTYSSSFVDMLIEVCKVSMGIKSSVISRANANYIAEFMAGRDIKPLMKFTMEVAGLSYLKRNAVIAAFMRAHESMEGDHTPEVVSKDYIKSVDLSVMSQNVEVVEPTIQAGEVKRVPSLAEMFGGGEQIDNSIEPTINNGNSLSSIFTDINSNLINN